ncbi:cytochrome P450 [Actinokineospora pegani]|uniref:cytochrome P450 n=1 Tax=Actinokineospora pegani TaxID=2654637 RepID=UPI0038B2D1B0
MLTMGRNALAWVRKLATKAVLKRVGPRALSLLPAGALVPLRRDDVVPVAELDELADQGPIVPLPVPFGVNLWLVTGHEAVKQVLADSRHFSNDFSHLGKILEVEQNPGGLGFADPPVHTRLRKVLTPEFTMRRLARLAPRIDAIIADCLDSMAETDGPVDLVEKFALPIPSLTICELLGVPYSDRDEFQRLAEARFDLFGGAGAGFGHISESLVYLRKVVAQQRENPGDGLIGMIIREHGDQIDDDELAGLADGVLTGGFETTASMLALGGLMLLRDPATADLLRESDEAINPFVEEMLRYLSVVQVAFLRFAREEVTVGGQPIAPGDVVACSLSAANRDPALGDDVRQFDPSRAPSPHVAFGYGAHRCIGAELARMELRAAYPALVRRFPNLRLNPDADTLTFRETSIVYGVESISVLT